MRTGRRVALTTVALLALTIAGQAARAQIGTPCTTQGSVFLDARLVPPPAPEPAGTVRDPNGWLVVGGLTLAGAAIGAFQAAMIESLAGSPVTPLESAAIYGAVGLTAGVVYCLLATCDWSAPPLFPRLPPRRSPPRINLTVGLTTLGLRVSR